MSDEIKQGDDSISDGREGAGNRLFDLVVKCYRDVYRRAGIPFTRGENTLVDITEEQVRIIERDSVLKIVSGAPASPSPETGSVGDVVVDSELKSDATQDEQLTARILAAVAGLDKNNQELFTTAGTPKVAAVCAALGETITGAQLNAALATLSGDA
jgi:hypothetical protein